MKQYRTSTFIYQCKNTCLIGNKFPIKNTWELTSERQSRPHRIKSFHPGFNEDNYIHVFEDFLLHSSPK